jgi:hypothetical protein
VFYLFLLVVALAGIGIYVLFVLNLVPGAAEERLGVLEPLPPDTGTWKPDPEGEGSEPDLLREVRHYFYESEGRLVRQVRYRNRQTNEIVRADPDQVVKRRRIRK